MPQAAAGNVISSANQIGSGVINSTGILDGTILDADINSAAAIAYSKLNLAGAILSTDLAGSIADSKLNQITTASKVSGAALTSLSSIPAGAGVIPVANLPNQAVPAWVDEGSVSWAAETADKTITITNGAKSIYMLILAFSVANTQLGLRFNGDTGSNYAYRGITATGVAETTASDTLYLGASQSVPWFGVIMFPGKAVASKISVAVQAGIYATGANNTTLMGLWSSASDPTSVTIRVIGATCTGKAHLYSLAL